MSSVNNISSSTPVQKIVQSPIRKEVPAEAPAQLPMTDTVQLSGYLAALKANDIRADKVADIKAQIAAGTYEDDKKLDAAIDKLLDDLNT